VDRWAEHSKYACFSEYCRNHEVINCPFCREQEAKMIASMQDSVKTVLYYTCKMCGDFQTTRNAYGLHLRLGGAYEQD
jgi:hypothetical protein